MNLLDVTSQFLETPGSPLLSPKKIAQGLSLQVSDLAESTHIDYHTLSARPEAAKVQEMLRAIVRVISAAVEVFGDNDIAIAWMMSEPVAAFRQRTAFELVTGGQVEAVVTYLESIGSGFVG